MTSRLNINRNIFLEKEELLRFQSFLINDTVSQVMLDNTSSWGIVRTVFSGPSPDFLIEVGTNVGTIKLATDSKAVDSDKELIKQSAFDNLSIPNDGQYYWIKISHDYTALEQGVCSVNVNGEVSGINTKFSEVLRGQNTEVPVKIKFYKSSGLLNDQVYEVVSLNVGAPDTQLILSGYGFVDESNLNYSVIGSTPVGEILTSAQLEGLYQYDACKIELIPETTLNTPPIIDFVSDKQFYLARVINNSGVIAIEDKRTQFLTFNVEGVSNKLDKSANLSDLNNAATARANLGVMSAVETAALFADSGWKNLVRGAAGSATDFNLKIRRIGKVCLVQGTFKGGSNTSPNAIIASIPYTELFASGQTVILPSVRHFFNPGAEFTSGNQVNRGMFGYVPSSLESDAVNLYLKVDSYTGAADQKFNINFTIFLG